MKALRLTLSVMSAMAGIAPAVAESSPPPGAVSCSGCHAVRQTVSSPVPEIYGKSLEETVTAMAAFRDGSRPSTVMNRIAKGFSDDETRAIAAWLAAQNRQPR